MAWSGAGAARARPRGDRIESQGSFNYIIKAFLNRKDVEAMLNQTGICGKSISIKANELEIDKQGKFTGRLAGGVRTKYNRIYQIKKNALFIGDEKDEAVLRKTGVQGVSFVNWKKLVA